MDEDRIRFECGQRIREGSLRFCLRCCEWYGRGVRSDPGLVM